MARLTYLSRCLRLFLALAASPSTAGAAEARLPIFDTHMHYSEPAWSAYPPEAVLAAMRQAGVARAVVSSTPDDGTLKLLAADGQRFVPELRPYRGTVGSGNWTADAATPGYLEARLARTRYFGIGEFHLHGADDVSEVVLATADLALAHDIPLHVHAGAAPVEALFAARPALKILWAHAGMSSPAAEIAHLLDRHAKLWAELSFRAADVAPGGRIDDEWRALLLRHAGRFMIGTDTYVTGRWADYAGLIEAHRAWLVQLPTDAAERIAWRNAAALYGDGGLAELKP